jgi:hypothetical protein
MNAGYQLTAAVIDQAIGRNATAQRDLARSQADLLATIAALGADDDARLAALTSLAQGAKPDPAGWAAAALYQAQVANTLAQVYYGIATQAQPFDFDNALSSAWGAQ